MARRSFDVFDLIELFTHWHAGRSQRQLAQSLGIDRRRSRSIGAGDRGVGDSGRGAGHRGGVGSPYRRWFPEIADPGLRSTTWPGIEVHRDRIRDWRPRR